MSDERKIRFGNISLPEGETIKLNLAKYTLKKAPKSVKF